MKNIFYISYLHLTNKIKEDLYIEQLLSRNYLVYYVDLFALFFKKLKASETENERFIVRISSYAELETFLKTINVTESLFISTITFEYRSLYLYKLLTRYHVKLAFLARGMIPIPSMEVPLFYRFIKNPLYFFKIKKLVLFSKNKISFLFKYFRLVKPYDIIFLAGNYGFFTIGEGKRIDFKKAHIININYFDYDKYLDMNDDNEILLDEQYCVFIDQFLPHHPDLKMFNKKEVNSYEYYKLLNCFFDDMERKLGIRVVIAAHPKSEYEINPFNDRLLIKHRTAELVKSAKMIFTHNSTSVSYGILFNKPICVLWSSVLEDLFRKESLKLFAYRFGGLVVNLDEYNIDDFEIPVINSQKYERYKFDFLTSPDSQYCMTIHIFLKALEEING